MDRSIARIVSIQRHLCFAHEPSIQLQTASETSSTETREISPGDVVLVGYARTPIGNFAGALSPLTAVTLGAKAIQGALAKAGVSPSSVDEVYMGNVLQANLGQAPARQAALAAGISYQTPCTTIHKVCASGMKSVMLGASNIMLNISQVVVAGGMESMSNVPYYLPYVRQGLRLGDNAVVDGLIKDGLWDPYGNCHMGTIAEKIAKKYQISKDQQDDYAIRSYTRATNGWKEGFFKKEVIPIIVKSPRGPEVTVDQDEEFKKFSAEKLKKLTGNFGGDKSVTAGNASSLSDGAAALVLMSAAKAKEMGIRPLAVIRGFADAALHPDDFPIAPTVAIPKAVQNAGLKLSDIDYFEINEAFSVMCEANIKILNLDPSKVNIFGGAVSLGHPIGCSGARIIVTLLNVLEHKQAKFGVAGICNGGGGASAIVVERL
eukprot:TRINITY_DN910_c0_g2_i1.p1 TRINITY_DN910_c0_g2~~TRINITY_DN910_c0_g2_i1.p1  ORF type:complete len:433 (-),score=82.95 TRINITY_DN910_c0_g2_i1:144-1442(-)